MTEIQFKEPIGEPVCLALGFFDSVHAGHRMIIRRMKEYASAQGCLSAVFTFDNNAYRIFNSEDKQVYTFEERKDILCGLGVDRVLHAKFDKYFKAVSPEEFLNTLFDTLNLKGVFCGYDYLFGCGGKGDAQMLKAACENRGIHVEIMPEIDFSGERISTTVIKEYLRGRRIETANLFLEQPFFMKGKVVRGRGVGHLYNTPTANLAVSKDKLLPGCGVYGTYTVAEGKRYKSVTNIGDKPTFNESSITIETMMDGFGGDLYDREVSIEFIKFIRDIRKFATPLELSNQIRMDLNWRNDD